MAITTLVLDGAGSHGKTSGVVDPCVERLKWKLGCGAHWVEWRASLMGVGDSFTVEAFSASGTTSHRSITGGVLQIGDPSMAT